MHTHISQRNLFNEIKRSVKDPMLIIVSDTKSHKEICSVSKSEKNQLRDLYNDCLENAKSLLDEARTLQAQYSFARACFLAISSYEEIGKSQLIKHRFNGWMSRETCNDCFRKHPKKYAMLNIKLKRDKSGNTIIEFDNVLGGQLLHYRGNTLYVGKDNVPNSSTTRDQAYYFIKVATEWLNLHYDKKINWENSNLDS